MKSILRLLTAMLPLCMICLSCSDDEPFSTVGPDDEPHILSPMFPDRQNGELPVIAAISRDANFKMTLTVTPADYTDVVWYIDGDKAAEGDSIDIGLPAGLYTMKVVATTVKGKSTSREGLIRVNPLDGDPWSAEKGYERFVAPGTVAVLYGDNLEQVRSVRIGNSTPSPAAYSTEGGTPHLTYTVPTDVEDGTHRVFLTDTDGEEFGANTVTVSKTALVTSGAGRARADAEWTLTGINLDKIASLKVGDAEIRQFTHQTSDTIRMIFPTLAEGEYTLTGTTKDGGKVRFCQGKSVVEQMPLSVTTELVIWSGHHYVSWGLADGDPNKTFNLIDKDVFATVKAGTVMAIHYSTNPEDTYHQLQPTTAWWTALPGADKADVDGAGVYEFTLTRDVLGMIMEQDGFIVTGHGIYIDSVVLK